MNKLVGNIVGLGIPGVILLGLVAISPYAGAAAIIATLAAFGPGGILGGVFCLMLITLISKGITEWGFDAIYENVLIDLQEKKGVTLDDIESRIDNAWITESLKIKLKTQLGILDKSNSKDD